MYHHGKFTKPGAVKSTATPSAAPPKGQSDQHQQEHGEKQAAHGHQPGGSEKHVTQTHPGQTQPHPITGVHAFHGHHVGGGKYQSHTHHDDGSVQTQDHESAGDMHMAMQEALPDDQGMGGQNGMEGGGDQYADVLGQIGHEGSGG